MTFDLLQGHVIQYGHQTLFQVSKLSFNWPYLQKFLRYFAQLFVIFCYSPVLNYRSKKKKKSINTFIWLQDPVK